MTTLKGSAIGLAVLFLAGIGITAARELMRRRTSSRRTAPTACARRICWVQKMNSRYRVPSRMKCRPRSCAWMAKATFKCRWLAAFT